MSATNWVFSGDSTGDSNGNTSAVDMDSSTVSTTDGASTSSTISGTGLLLEMIALRMVASAGSCQE